jgi:hypothetical protein
VRRVVLVILVGAVSLALACGETRRPLGDECLRSDDCLSGVCAFRTCVSAPPLATGSPGTPADETPLLPPPSDAGREDG